MKQFRFGDFTLTQREDGYINVAELVEPGNKKTLEQFLELPSTKKLMSKIKKETGKEAVQYED